MRSAVVLPQLSYLLTVHVHRLPCFLLLVPSVSTCCNNLFKCPWLVGKFRSEFLEPYSFYSIQSQHFIICPIAIAYSMGQIIKSVCVCLSVCLSVCPCVVTLTVAFLCRFLPNLTQRCKPPKVRTSSLGVNIAEPIPLFYP